MRIYETTIGIGNTDRKPDISFKKNDGDILKNYVEFNSTQDRIYVDFNIIDDTTLYNMVESEESRIENTYNNNTQFDLNIVELKNELMPLTIDKSFMTVLPNITVDDTINGDDILLSIAIDSDRFQLLRYYTSDGEIILTRLDTTNRICSAVMKFNYQYNKIIRDVTIYLYDKKNNKFIKFLAKMNGNEINFYLSECTDSKIINSYNPDRTLTTFKLKFDTVPTKYIIYNPNYIDKDALIKRIENQSKFTPILISYDKFKTIDELSNFLDNSLATRHVRSITFYGIDETIPFNVFRNMRNVFFANSQKIQCVKSS